METKCPKCGGQMTLDIKVEFSDSEYVNVPEDAKIGEFISRLKSLVDISSLDYRPNVDVGCTAGCRISGTDVAGKVRSTVYDMLGSLL